MRANIKDLIVLIIKTLIIDFTFFKASELIKVV